jgi:YidC/Oxa1 family membrane protein insertase
MKTGAIMANITPKMKEIQNDIVKYQRENDHIMQTKKVNELTHVFKSNNVNPLSMLVGPAIQAPIFMSMFFGLQKMLPVYPSFKEGGMLWFTDLTVSDPTFGTFYFFCRLFFK